MTGLPISNFVLFIFGVIPLDVLCDASIICGVFQYYFSFIGSIISIAIVKVD